MTSKVLVVDDCSAARQQISATLAQIGRLSVFETQNGFGALKLLPRYRFDLIITDLNMPDINGLELVNFVKKNPNYRETPLFIVSTVNTESLRLRGMALGAAEWLIKPVDPTLLTDLVRGYLGI